MPDKSSDKPKSRNEGTPIREGQEDSSILNNKDREEKRSYPRPGEADRQFDNQAEFIDPEANLRDEEEK